MPYTSSASVRWFPPWSCVLLALALLCSGCAWSPAPRSPQAETALAVEHPYAGSVSTSSPPLPAFDAATPAEAYGLALAAWSHGNLEDAESTILAAVHQFPDDQRLLLFEAACLRSAGQMDGAYQLFYRIYELDPTTAEGRCALSMIYLDTHKQEDNVHFMALRNLVVNERPDDVLLRWMLATQCANYSVDFEDADPHTRLSLAEEGATHFRRIFQQVEAAPVPLHAAMGDVLTYLGRHDEARRHLNLADLRHGDQ